MRHAAIFELELRHAYYEDAHCPDFEIEPSAETAQKLASHRCQIGSSRDGIRVLTALDDSGLPFLPLPQGAVLRFALRPRNHDLALFTDLDAVTAQQAPLYTNQGDSGSGGGELHLHQGAPTYSLRREGLAEVAVHLNAASSNGNVALASYSIGHDRLAEVAVHLNAASSNGNVALASYSIRFSAKRLRWAYYCLIDKLPSGAELRIFDASPTGSTDVVSFSDANRTRLDETPDQSDPIGTQLVARHRGLHCFRFLSDEPVACRQAARRYLELRLGNDRLLASLPNPALRSMAPGSQLYRVIRYQTQPTLTQ